MTYSVDIPEFHFDVIARIVPGLALLLAYIPPWRADAQSFSIMDGIVILVPAYLIGITADNALNQIEALICRLFKLNSAGEALKHCRPDTSIAGHTTKSVAETIMFRSCAILCIPLFFKRAALFEGYSDYEYKLFIFGFLAIFLYCYTMRLARFKDDHYDTQDVGL